MGTQTITVRVSPEAARGLTSEIYKPLPNERNSDYDPAGSLSAVIEILSAIGLGGRSLYTKVFHSAPEGPDGQDDWTRDKEPVGRAKQVIDEFVAFFKSISGKVDQNGNS